MDAQLLKSAGEIAGIGGLALGVFLLLFKDLLKKIAAPTMTKEQWFRVVIIFMVLVWSIAIVGLGAWVWGNHGSAGPIPSQPKIQIGKVREFPWTTDSTNPPGKLIILYVDFGPKQGTQQRYKNASMFRKDNHKALRDQDLFIFPDLDSLLKDRIARAPNDAKLELETFSSSEERKKRDSDANTDQMGFFWEYLGLEAPVVTFELRDENKKTLAAYDYYVK